MQLGEDKKIRESPAIMPQFFTKPKCKPWDLVKGRRLRCCHGKGEHTRWCLSKPVLWKNINYGMLTAKDITDAIG